MKKLTETRSDFRFRQVEDFVNTAVETWLKEHGQQA
jgi:hypothetical protein